MKPNSRDTILLVLVLISLSGFSQADLAITPDVSVEISDGCAITLSGDWLNQGVLNSQYGTVVFNGTADQNILNASGQFGNINIDKPTGETFAQSNLLINNNLIVTSGLFDLNGQVVTLTSGDLSETESSRVQGESGYLSTIRELSSPNEMNVANFGLYISSAQYLGQCTIHRGHNSLEGGGVSSINRWFSLESDQLGPFTTDIYMKFFLAEAVGHVLGDLKMYRSLDGGITWEELPGFLEPFENIYVCYNVSGLGIFTLSSFDMTVVSCIGDFNLDGFVDTQDLLTFLGQYGCNSGCSTDLNGDDQVDTSDLLIFLGVFGSVCS